ncbi:hypothetical protein EIL87_02400, partial [Saccharopolyspora rhizosphaerae]
MTDAEMLIRSTDAGETARQPLVAHRRRSTASAGRSVAHVVPQVTRTAYVAQPVPSTADLQGVPVSNVAHDRYEPSEEFAAQANATSALYEQAEADREAFWAEQA